MMLATLSSVRREDVLLCDFFLFFSFRPTLLEVDILLPVTLDLHGICDNFAILLT